MMGGSKAGQIVQRREISQMVKRWRCKAIIKTC